MSTKDKASTKVIYFICQLCRAKVPWVFRIAHKNICRECREGEGQYWGK